MNTCLNPAADSTRQAQLPFVFKLLGLLLIITSLGCPEPVKESENGGSKQGMQPAETTDLIAKKRKESKQLKKMVSTEDLILDLSPRLGKFAKYLETSSSTVESPELPIDFVECQSITALQESPLDAVLKSDPKKPSFVQSGYWPIADEALANKNPWGPLKSLKADWQTVKFGVVSGDFSNDEQTRFTLHTKSEGRGSSSDEDGASAYFGFKGVQDLIFEYETGQWHLVEWKQVELKLIRSPTLLFEESLATALPDVDALAKAQRSYMDEIILATSKSGTFDLPDEKYVPWTTMTADHVFPSVAVVDYNADGHDDLFLTARWGPAQLLKNNGDGTFADVTAESGLSFDYLVNCALFVDLDNDGDQDALIGRPMEPAQYFLNENGRFTNVTASHSDLATQEQFFVSAITATDVNRDGLLDIYMSTYPPLAKRDTGFEHHFLNEYERKKYIELRAKKDRWVDTPGTANLLLMNRGDGRLERIEYEDAISQWRRSYQSVWGDFDNDGDDDLYVCNDFAPDAILRNDTPVGAAQPVLVEVTNERLKLDGIGFGMGASYGDFDQDGDLDLYVSNMFSKAGNRIFNKLDSVDPRLRGAAAGCFLFVNEDGQLTQSAGSGDDEYHVNQVGWSYGGQWSDFDNDGKLDIYVPTGFYSAPNEIATQVDL